MQQAQLKHIPERIQQTAPPQTPIEFKIYLNVTTFINVNILYSRLHSNIKIWNRKIWPSITEVATVI